MTDINVILLLIEEPNSLFTTDVFNSEVSLDFNYNNQFESQFDFPKMYFRFSF